MTSDIILESFDVNAGIGLILSQLDNNDKREFNLHLFEGYTEKSINLKLSNEDISRLWHLLVPYFSDDFNE